MNKELRKSSMSVSKKKRVCVIGCGPSGMSMLLQLGKLSDAEIPDIVCYEKQDTVGGLWNVTWRTGSFMQLGKIFSFRELGGRKLFKESLGDITSFRTSNFQVSILRPSNCKVSSLVVLKIKLL